MGISTDVHDPNGMKHQNCSGKIQRGTWIVKRYVRGREIREVISGCRERPLQKEIPKHGSSHFGVIRSATLPNVRTPYLRLRLPAIIRRVQRGQAKLVVNTAKLGEFLSLGPEDINRLAPLFSGPLPERTRPVRKKID
jgi:hypothetical protein